jgi:glucose-6-phosphate 1-dehydrogenase
MSNERHTSTHSASGRSDALVMFGLTGDLGAKKLFPAIAELAGSGELDHPVVAVGRRELGVDELRSRLRDAIADRADDAPTVDEHAADQLDLHYVRGDVGDADTFEAIADAIGGASRPTVYAALPPDLFGTIAGALADSTLGADSRLVLEKPFGEDAMSARELWDEITSRLAPERLFVVDHFLAKAAIENLVTVRTHNALIANNLQPGLVRRIDVLMHESGGVDGRGSFYESVGAIRDVVQNHMLQLLALATMERPDDDGDAAYLDARQRLLEAVTPIERATFGQYVGYRELDDVDDDSAVETFAELEVGIDADPWREVPVRLVTGKRLHEQRTAVVITVGTDRSGTEETHDDPGCGRLVFDISPTPCISIELEVLDPDDHQPAVMTLAARQDEHHDGLGDYATMLRDALHGERRHFATIDGILAGWRIVDPVLRDRPEVIPYEPGTSGPTT